MGVCKRVDWRCVRRWGSDMGRADVVDGEEEGVHSIDGWGCASGAVRCRWVLLLLCLLGLESLGIRLSSQGERGGVREEWGLGRDCGIGDVD